MMNNKNKSVTTLTKGVEYLFKKNKITSLQGKGSILSEDTVAVTDKLGKKINYKAKNIIISTGSLPTSLPDVKIDEKKYYFINWRTIVNNCA